MANLKQKKSKVDEINKLPDQTDRGESILHIAVKYPI